MGFGFRSYTCFLLSICPPNEQVMKVTVDTLTEGKIDMLASVNGTVNGWSMLTPLALTAQLDR
jgi:hypothetical protein